MREVRFHRDLYQRSAVEAAVQTLASYAALEIADEAPYTVVRVTADKPARERRVALELQNHALVQTTRERGPV